MYRFQIKSNNSISESADWNSFLFLTKSYFISEWMKFSYASPTGWTGSMQEHPMVTLRTVTFNIKQIYRMCCVDLRTNSHYFTIQHWLTRFYNRDGVCLLRGTESIFKYNPVNFRLQSVNLTMFEPFKRKLTSPSNRYLEAISLGPVHKRMPTPSVTPAPISYPVSSQPPLHSPGSEFQIHKGTISARKCRLAYREYCSGCTVYLSTSSLFISQLRWLPMQWTAFSNNTSASIQFLRIQNTWSFLIHFDPRNWKSVVKYGIIIILLYSPSVVQLSHLGESMKKFCHED